MEESTEEEASLMLLIHCHEERVSEPQTND
jgi:hypothetical protein